MREPPVTHYSFAGAANQLVFTFEDKHEEVMCARHQTTRHVCLATQHCSEQCAL